MGYSKKLYNILGGLQVCIITAPPHFVHIYISQNLQGIYSFIVHYYYIPFITILQYHPPVVGTSYQKGLQTRLFRFFPFQEEA